MDLNPPRQTFNYHTKIVKCLSSIASLRFISSYPISDYPIGKKRYFKYQKEVIELSNKVYVNRYIPFVNTPILKVITRFISALFFLVSEFKCSKPDYLCVYSVHIPYMLAGLIISKIFKTKTLAVWTDPPALKHPSDGQIKRRLRAFELIISKKLMASFDKLIVISKYLAEDFANGKPYLVVDSIFDSELDSLCNFTQEKKRYDRGAPKLFVYSGTISKKYGLDIMLDAFSCVSDACLHIYGSGCDTEYLKKKIEKVHNIEYKGLLDINEIRKVQSNSDFLLNVRNQSDEFTKYSFPSKITEYLLSRRPVLSSVLPGISDEYYQFLIPLEAYDTSLLKERIMECISSDNETLNSRSQMGYDFIIKRDVEHWANKIKKLLNND
ncbi:hypothetical protein VCSRO177_2250 [Vibrio cholerae]|nr:hypothetical protein VCSRO177_2250 [Vibrio cholerae]